MIKTSVYFDTECYQYLQGQRHQMGKTILELVREIIHVTMKIIFGISRLNTEKT